MRQGSGGKLLVGFVVLHVLCCGILLLGGAGALAAAGGLLGQPLLVAAGALLVAVAVGLAVRRARGSSGPRCAPEPADVPRTTADRS
ncbi:MAG: hypothetical protein M4D85_11655 [Actinomycetota bacterium]|nr:hypothetical protein [Actinomycetota bacterium]